GNFYAGAFVCDGASAILINRERPLCSTLSFNQIQFCSEGEQCVRVNVRVYLIVCEEEARERCERLRLDCKQNAVAVEIFGARANLKRSSCDRLRRVGKKDCEV